jgi:tRNA threonylcarbamoyladenosine biosynthesis protein TsaE
MPTRDIMTASPAATQALGRRVGSVLRAGSVIGLTGELGSGKTLLTRGICEGLGVPLRQVNSPTFVLVNEYRGRLPVFHLDVYRLGGTADVVDLGITDYFQRAGEGVMVVEWAEKLPGVLPEDRLDVSIERLSARKRRFSFSSAGPRFTELFKVLDEA